MAVMPAPSWLTDILGGVMPRSRDLGESVLHLVAIALLMGVIPAAVAIYIGKWFYGRNADIGR
jgi:hypothetical protein